MAKRFVVIGLGNFGASAAAALYARGHEVIAVDTSPDAVDLIAASVSRAAVADGRQLRALERAGAAGADAAVVSTGDDLTASILATMALRDLRVPEIYVKVISDEHARVMARLGATETVFPEREAAQNLANRLAGRNVLDYFRLGPGISVQEMAVPGAWEGKTLRELGLRAAYDVSVVAVHDVLTDRFHIPPDPDAVLKDSDTLVLAGTERTLDKVGRLP